MREKGRGVQALNVKRSQVGGTCIRLQSLLGERLPEGWQAAFDMERVLV